MTSDQLISSPLLPPGCLARNKSGRATQDHLHYASAQQTSPTCDTFFATLMLGNTPSKYGYLRNIDVLLYDVDLILRIVST